MIIVDATIVNVAIPSIIRDLHIGITQAVMSAFQQGQQMQSAPKD